MSNRLTHSGLGTAEAPKLLQKLEQQLSELDLDRVQFPVAISVDAPQLDPWSWLSVNRTLTPVAWSDRDSGKLLVAVGIAASVVAKPNQCFSETVALCREILGADEQLRFFGGFSFDGTDAWPAFGAGKFVLPGLQFTEETLTLVVVSQSDVAQARLDLQRVCCEAEPLKASFSLPKSRTDSPNIAGWQSKIDEALSLIRSEVIEKIVLSRQAKMMFSDPLNPVALANRLQAATHDCFVFCFGFGDRDAFVGATPERLFLRQESQLLSEVVAGTRMRGKDAAEDERLAVELLTSDKDQREHDIVRKSIRQRLHKFVNHLQVDTQASILRLARKQHLRSGVQGTLKATVDDGMLLKRLHPTPAVGGYPTENALPEIARIEPFNRGWYAAPVGWIGANSAQFAVAIRSGLVQGNSLSLFSGAGIVRGSDPLEEWQEVENKIQDFVSVLNADL